MRRPNCTAGRSISEVKQITEVEAHMECTWGQRQPGFVPGHKSSDKSLFTLVHPNLCGSDFRRDGRDLIPARPTYILYGLYLRIYSVLWLQLPMAVMTKFLHLVHLIHFETKSAFCSLCVVTTSRSHSGTRCRMKVRFCSHSHIHFPFHASSGQVVWLGEAGSSGL